MNTVSRPVECVEIYVPKKLEHLSELYRYLQGKLNERGSTESSITIDGFSLYEVDGAFYGGTLVQERTLVVRILFVRDEADDKDDSLVQAKIHELGRDVATAVMLSEEEIWICHYPQNVFIFKPDGAKQPASDRASAS